MEGERKTYRYRCDNPSCPNFEQISESTYPQTFCSSCGRPLEEVGGTGERTVAGLAGGALLGWAVGGPVGAFWGAVIGAMLGGSAEDAERRKKRYGGY